MKCIKNLNSMILVEKVLSSSEVYTTERGKDYKYYRTPIA